jgi:hypothetical protein
MAVRQPNYDQVRGADSPDVPARRRAFEIRGPLGLRNEA